MRVITPILLLTTLSLTSPFALPSLSNQIINNPVLVEQIQPVKLPVKAKPKKKINLNIYKKKVIGCAAVANMLRDLGVGYTERNYGVIIIRKESGCNQFARNRQSGATGLPQSLPASKMRSAGADYMWNPRTQLKWFKSYVKQRYGTMKKAYLFQLRNGWY